MAVMDRNDRSEISQQIQRNGKSSNAVDAIHRTNIVSAGCRLERNPASRPADAPDGLRLRGVFDVKDPTAQLTIYDAFECSGNAARHQLADVYFLVEGW